MRGCAPSPLVVRLAVRSYCTGIRADLQSCRGLRCIDFGGSLTVLPVGVADAQTPSTFVAIPSNNATVSGTSQILDAGASTGVTQVQYEITGGTLNDSVIATATAHHLRVACEMEYHDCGQRHLHPPKRGHLERAEWDERPSHHHREQSVSLTRPSFIPSYICSTLYTCKAFLHLTLSCLTYCDQFSLFTFSVDLSLCKLFTYHSHHLLFLSPLVLFSLSTLFSMQCLFLL